MNKISLSILFVVGGAIAAFCLNTFILEDYIVKDFRYAHNNNPGLLFNMFYSTAPCNSCHPVSSTFNLFFTVIVGTIPGLVFYKFTTDKAKKTGARA